MAIYHLSAKPISRSAGRSATGAAAYRAGDRLYDERTGLTFDYTHKSDVLHSELLLPGGGHADREDFWNALELHHKRQDAIVAREIELALPSELTAEQRHALAVGFARELADRYGVAADVALHTPRPLHAAERARHPERSGSFDPALGWHNGNWHAHILLSACHVSPQGELGRKAVELDPIHCQRHRIENLAERERARWADLANQALEQAGHAPQLDHRSHAARGLAQEPGQHLGPAAAGYERRTGQPSQKRLNHAQDVEAAQRRRDALERLDDEWQQVHRTLRYAQGQAVDGPLRPVDASELQAGLAEAEAQYHAWQAMEAARQHAEAEQAQREAERERAQHAFLAELDARRREREAEMQATLARMEARQREREAQQQAYLAQLEEQLRRQREETLQHARAYDHQQDYSQE